MERPDGPIVMKARWQPLARCSMLFEGGRISEWLTRVLLEMRQLRRIETPVDTPFLPLPEPSPHLDYLVYYVPRDPERLVLVFQMGEPDIFDLAHELYPRYDFALDPHTPGLERIPQDGEWSEIVPLADVRAMVERQFRPLFDAMLTLRAAGYRNVFFHDVTPPSLERKPGWKPYRLRFKLAVLTNQIFKEFSQSSGIELIEAWNDLTIEGTRDMRYDEDGVHLNREAAIVSVRLLQDLIHPMAPA